MPSMISGVTRSDLVLANGLVLDMETYSHLLEQDSYVLETLTRMFNKTKDNPKGLTGTTRMEHKLRERRMKPDRATVTAAAAAAATAIRVDHPEYFHRDDVIYCPATDEQFLMNEDTGGTGTAGSITVVNDSGSGGITTAIPINSKLVILQEAHAEGEAIPPAYNVVEEEVSTYLQQFDKTVQVTDVQNSEEHYGPKELLKRRKDAWIEVKRGLNLMLYMGQQVRETTTASGARRQVMRGLIEWLASYTTDAGSISGGITLKTLGQMLRPTKQYSSSSPTKIGICGQKAWDSISAFPNGSIQINPGKGQNWGITLKELATPFGDIMVAYDQVLSDEFGLADRLFILDGKQIKQLEKTELPLVMKLNIQDNTDIHNIKDVITGTRGMALYLPELHRHVYNCQ